MLVLAAGCNAADHTEEVRSALSAPAPGETLTLGFETDAADRPLARGTYLDEQFAAVGVHFNGAFALGERTIDFPDYKVPPLSDIMICTWVAFQDTGRCFPPIGLMDAQLVVDFDFPACDVTIEGRTRGDGQQDGDFLTVTAFDASGGFIATVTEGVNTGPNPPTESVVHATVSGANIARVVIEDGELDALDTLVVHRCPPENRPPDAVCADRDACTLPGLCVGTASIDGGSSDPDGDPLAITQTPDNPYPLGTTAVTLLVSDGAESATCQAEVTIRDCEDPAIACPAPITLECTGNRCADATPGAATATDNCSIASVTGPGAQCFPLGTTTLAYTAQDGSGNTASCASAVTVIDTQPPVVTVGPPPNLGQPNHRYETITLADCGATIVDACEGTIPVTPPDAAITCVTSDEPDDDTGDGKTINDIIIVDATTVMLRAERAGSGDGRVYNIAFTATDGAGNPTTGICRVEVDKGARPPIDSGPAQTVCR